MPDVNPTAVMVQFCFECGRQFLRLRTKTLKPQRCGFCIYETTMGLEGLTNAGREYAESGLLLWQVTQEALRSIPGAPQGVVDTVMVIVDGEVDDDLPF